MLGRLLTDLGAKDGEFLQMFGGDFVHDVGCILVKQWIDGDTQGRAGTLEPTQHDWWKQQG